MANTLYTARRVENVETEGEQAIVHTEVHAGWSNGSVAQILPTSQAPVVQKSWLRADIQDLSRAGNGSKTYKLGDGAYIANSVWRSMQEHSVYFIVESGKITVVDDQDDLVAHVFGLSKDELKALKASIKAEEDKAKGDKLSQFNVPTLTGSEKQIAWALQIRERFLLQIAQRRADGKFSALQDMAADAICKKAESRFWIDSRDLRLDALLELVM